MIKIPIPDSFQLFLALLFLLSILVAAAGYGSTMGG